MQLRITCHLKRIVTPCALLHVIGHQFRRVVYQTINDRPETLPGFRSSGTISCTKSSGLVQCLTGLNVSPERLVYN